VLAKLFEGIGAEFGDGFWPGSTGVEQSTHNPSIKGSTAAAGSGKQKKIGKVMEAKVSD
jgi:hypothetical protein